MFVELKAVHYTYVPNTPFEVHALQGIDLSIERGECVGIIGRTGCGKSTLIQHFNALLIPSRGTVTIDGVPTHRKGVSLKEVRRKVGLVFQYPEHQIFEENVFSEVAFGPRNLGIHNSELEERVRWSIKAVGLDYGELHKVSPFELSGGQMRRVALASVLSMRPQLLVLDEPTAGLDPEGKRSILGQINDFRKEWGMTVVIVSHSMEDLASIAERLLVMDKGRIELDGPTRDIFSRNRELESLGVRAPVTTRTAHLLGEQGFTFSKQPLNPVELAKEILHNLKKKQV